MLASGLLPLAEAHGVAFAPGARYCSDGDDRSLRLAFSLYDEATLTEGARRLDVAVSAAQARRAWARPATAGPGLRPVNR